MNQLCPRCGIDADGNTPPICADEGYNHADTCATYTFSADVCAACHTHLHRCQPTADDQTGPGCQPNDREAS